ncbi:MAG TPA: alpha/beta fold hydrolase [Anaerolineae bacterium]|nr:alpha/beta fold hydrolase [Anaerolineae bacterium]
MQAILAVFLITLGVGQLSSAFLGWRAASLVGPSRLAGYSLGILLLMAGALLLPGSSWLVLGWTLLAGPLALALLLLAGSYIAPPPHPDCLFEAQHPAHGSCVTVQIPDGEYLIPGFLLKPPDPPHPPLQGGMLIVHGAGDTKTSFKWRLVQSLLAEGFIVLTIDLPGHGDFRHRLLAHPDCLSVIPAAIQFLRQQPGVQQIGLVGISLGSAMAIKSLAQNLSGLPGNQVGALVALETPLEVRYSRGLYYGEMWNAFRAPVLSLLREVSVKQLRQSWFTGGYRSRHKNTGEVIELLNPLENMAQLGNLPILLVHGGRDIVAPAAAGLALQRAAPQAEFLAAKKASHVTLTLMPEVNRQVARWLREKLEDRG